MTSKYAPKQASALGKTVNVNSLELYYEEYGEGRPLLLLHGYGGSSQNWHLFVPELAGHYRLIVVDLRGHGYSSNPENRFTHKEAAGDVLLLLDQLGIACCSAMGMSTGGMVLLHLATSQPKRIDAMVLISATSYFPDQARNIMRRASFETMPLAVKEMYLECAKAGEEQIRQLISHFNALHDNYDDMDFTAQTLSAISARTLIVHGDRDHFFPLEIAVSIYRSIPDAALWIIPKGEHVPIYDSSIPFASEALRFLKEAN